MQSEADLANDLYGLEFSIAKSRRYHSQVRANWAKADRANKVMGTLSGSAVVAGLLGNIHWLAGLSGALVAVVSILDLVLDFGRHERMHDGLYRRFSELAQQAVAANCHPTAASLAELRQKRLAIEADELYTFRWIERQCARDEAISRGAEVNPIWLETRWTAPAKLVGSLWAKLPWVAAVARD